jgi:hypothetical protein
VSEEAIIAACKAGNVAQLKRWGRQGVRVATAGPLIYAVQVNLSFDVLYCLVKELGADVNQEMKGITALILASYLDHHDIMCYLVEELGADVNKSDDLHHTALWIAAQRGDLDTVRILLKLGANIDKTGNDGFTPLVVASYEKHEEVVKWLVKAGADTQALHRGAPNTTAASLSRQIGASAEQTAYLEAKTHCSNPCCSGAGVMKCTGCKQARYCGEECQLTHWKAHKVDCCWAMERQSGRWKGHLQRVIMFDVKMWKLDGPICTL